MKQHTFNAMPAPAVIPACRRQAEAGIQPLRHPPVSRNPNETVIPAQAGIQWFNNPFPRSGNDNTNDN